MLCKIVCRTGDSFTLPLRHTILRWSTSPVPLLNSVDTITDNAFLCRFSGILPIEIKNTVAYLDNWFGVLKNDKQFIISASGQAQKVVDFILIRQEQEPKEEVGESQK